MRSALVVGATPQGAGVNIGPLPNLRGAIAAIPVPAPTITATGSGNGSVAVSWNAVPGVNGYDIFRKGAHTSAWNLVGSTGNTQFTDSALTPGKTYLYRVQAYDRQGNRSPDSNYELATSIDYTDPQLTTSTIIRARHIIDVRTAVNAICTYAGAGICPSLPFSGSSLDETQLQTQTIQASAFTGVQNQIVSLRAAIGASAATFRETPAAGTTIKIIHMENLRAGAN